MLIHWGDACPCIMPVLTCTMATTTTTTIIVTTRRKLVSSLFSCNAFPMGFEKSPRLQYYPRSPLHWRNPNTGRNRHVHHHHHNVNKNVNDNDNNYPSIYCVNIVVAVFPCRFYNYCGSITPRRYKSMMGTMVTHHSNTCVPIPILPTWSNWSRGCVMVLMRTLTTTPLVPR